MWKEFSRDINFNEYSTRVRLGIDFSCFFSNAQFWLFRSLWFFPYIFRSVRLKLIWGM